MWSNDEVSIVCYDATSPLRHTRGRLGSARILRQLRKEGGAPGTLLIACAHQPLVTAWPEDAHETLIGREGTAGLWSQNRVDVALSGHVHVPLITTTHAGFPDLPRHFILAGAGTAVSHRVRPGAPNSFNVIKVAAEGAKRGVAITPYHFDPERLAFTAGAEAKFTETGDGWR